LDPPRIRIREVRDKIEDYVWEDIEWLQPYESHGPLKMDMVA